MGVYVDDIRFNAIFCRMTVETSTSRVEFPASHDQVPVDPLQMLAPSISLPLFFQHHTPDSGIAFNAFLTTLT